MLKNFTTIIFCFCLTNVNAQAGLWTWVNGDTAISIQPHFGTQGVADPLNHPYGVYEGCEWTDKQGNFWFYEGSDSLQWRSSLWKYQPTNNMWAWMKGTGLANDTGSYGLQGISSPTNRPPSRIFGMASWTDTSGGLWMYGGVNYLAGTNTFSDLWKFDIATNNWVWMQGPNISNQLPVWGVQGVSSPLNTPGARSEVVCTWTDNSNNLWLFGGSDVGSGQYNDLWKYNIASNEWTWMKGADSLNSYGYYGTKGVANALNTPSARYAYTRWKDAAGNFWMFGGWQVYMPCFPLGNAPYYNDMWKYDVNTNEWTWIDGPNYPCDVGSHSPVCLDSLGNLPASRMESRSCWVDKKGDFWMFGGLAFDTSLTFYAIWLNDMWKYSPINNEWKLMWSDTIPNQNGSFGIKGVASPCNRPLGRMGSVSWYESNTNSMYLFGGKQYYIPGSGRNRSILWKYEFDSSCVIYPCNTIGISEIIIPNQVNIFPNPSTSTLTIKGNFSQKQDIEILLFNAIGGNVLILRKKFNGGEFTDEINMTQLSKGIYFLQLRTTDNIQTTKVVKQ